MVVALRVSDRLCGTNREFNEKIKLFTGVNIPKAGRTEKQPLIERVNKTVYMGI